MDLDGPYNSTSFHYWTTSSLIYSKFHWFYFQVPNRTLTVTGSQPSRAVYMFLKLNNIPFEEVFVSIGAGEHRNEEFRKINPFRRVPVIDDNGFVLTESVAILKYLAKKYKAPSHWYPENDALTTARIDEYMNWQHQNLRQNCAMLFQNLILIPRMKGRPIDWEKVKFYRKKAPKWSSCLTNTF